VEKYGSFIKFLKFAVEFGRVEMKPRFLMTADIFMPVKGMGQFQN
jgi:hypothetical protein